MLLPLFQPVSFSELAVPVTYTLRVVFPLTTDHVMLEAHSTWIIIKMRIAEALLGQLLSTSPDWVGGLAAGIMKIFKITWWGWSFYRTHIKVSHGPKIMRRLGWRSKNLKKNIKHHPVIYILSFIKCFWPLIEVSLLQTYYLEYANNEILGPLRIV